MNKLLDDENEEDETFWNQEALKEEENDENYEEGEVVDVFDNDFDDDGIVLDMAKSCTFPLPLLAVAFQQLIAGSSHGHGNGGDDTLIKAWEKVYGVNITNAVKAETYSPEELANQITTESKSVNRIGLIGLGAMGFGMATHLLRSNFCVIAYDVYEPVLSRFANEGGLIGSSPAKVSKEAASRRGQIPSK